MTSSTVSVSRESQVHTNRSSAMFQGREGLAWPGQVFVFAIAAVVTLLRAPGFFLHANFYAEDGRYWFAEAYNSGWFHSLFFPHVGYLSVAERIPAGPAMLVPLHLAPLVFVIWGALCQLAPIPLLLSRRLRSLGPFSFRVGLALIYLLQPGSHEVFLVDTNCMWHLAVVVLLLILAAPPAGAVQASLDIALMVISGVSGPFSVVLTPLAIVAAAVRRTTWSIAAAVVTFAMASVQVLYVMSSQARLKGSLGATVPGFIRLFGGNLILGVTLGLRNWASHTPMIVLMMAALLGIAVYAVCFAEGSLEWRLIVGFGVIMLFVSLRAPLMSPGEEAWPLLIALTSMQRYWYLPGLTLLWAAAWCARAAHPRPLRWLGAVILVALPVGIVRDFRVPTFQESGFARQAQAFEAAPAGTIMEIPIPPGWVMELHKR
jgi:hypothetical protein